jgi:endoglucanase
VYRLGGTIASIGLLVALAAAIVIREADIDIDVPFVGEDTSSRDDALRQDQPVSIAGATAFEGRGALTIIGDQPATEPRLTVAINPPDGAEMMQLSDGPAFVDTGWESVADRAEIDVGGTGYREVFARFRLADGSVTQSSVAGGEVDPTWLAAISSETGPHQASWVQPFSSTELVVRIEAGRIEAGSLEAYDLDNPQPGDDVESRRGLRVVRRDGETYGFQVSARSDVIRRPDRLRGRPLDVEAVLGEPWTVISADDADYAQGVAPVSVRHLARPSDGGVDGDQDRLWAVVHDLVIVLPEPLDPGATYQVNAPTVAPAPLQYQPASITSPAVRVNQVGFAPADNPKVAYLAGWYDGIGVTATADPAPGFRVVDADTEQEVFAGQGRGRPVGGDLGRGDLTGAPVIELDFSPLNEDGRYRVCVDGVGCSHDFEIASDVWMDLATTVARALYHQRSGIALGPPHASFVRPRPYHPDDGVVVHASNYTQLQALADPMNTMFDRLVELRTEEVVDEAWGGHFDAGDWDRRIQHLWFVRNAAQLVMLFPERFEDLELNIPESGDAVPDLLDEALWSLDLYRRMQTADGAVRGGIEASEHPPANAASWVDDLAVMAFAPDPYSSYIYAGVAAEFAVALQPYDADRSDELLESAMRAMAWAEAQPDTVPGDGQVDAQRSVAAAALLLATGDVRWHDRFVETAGFLTDGDPHLSCHVHQRCDAAWLYLQADESVTDPAIRQQLRDRFLRSADALVELADQTAYGWTLEHPGVPLIWGLGAGGTPKISGLLRAYLVSGDERYRTAAVRSASVTLGSNPMGRVMLTGVGDDPVRYPQINDIKHGGLPTWPGTPVYGFHLLNSVDDNQWVVDDLLGPAGVSPVPTELPYLWQWYDVDSVALFNEFTIHQSHGEALLAFAVLAGTSS